MTLTLGIAGVVTAGLAVLFPRLLLAWYLYEARRLDIAQHPEDKIVTYPLA